MRTRFAYAVGSDLAKAGCFTLNNVAEMTEPLPVGSRGAFRRV